MLQDPMRAIPQAVEYVAEAVAEKSATLTSLAEGADLLVAGMTEQETAANVAEYYRIPLAALHFFPPEILLHQSAQPTMQSGRAQRQALGLPDERPHSERALEIQAYDEICSPGVATGWADSAARRPFVGALSLQLATDGDEQVLSWISGAPPPVYFGFGSMPVAAPNDTVAVISAACARVGARALICLGPKHVDAGPHSDHIKIVREVNHAGVFSACRAVVHHGGAGTTAAALRAGARAARTVERAGSAGVGSVRRVPGSRLRAAVFGVDPGFPHRGSTRDPDPAVRDPSRSSRATDDFACHQPDSGCRPARRSRGRWASGLRRSGWSPGPHLTDRPALNRVDRQRPT